MTDRQGGPNPTTPDIIAGLRLIEVQVRQYLSANKVMAGLKQYQQACLAIEWLRREILLR